MSDVLAACKQPDRTESWVRLSHRCLQLQMRNFATAGEEFQFIQEERIRSPLQRFCILYAQFPRWLM